MTIVRKNLMEQKNYSPYCGGDSCWEMPRTVFNGEQFVCRQCGWVSRFPKKFIDEYKEKWGIEMKAVSRNEFYEFIVKHNALGPEPDFSRDDCVCEDWWDSKHEEVIACKKYFNDGEMKTYIRE